MAVGNDGFLKAMMHLHQIYWCMARICSILSQFVPIRPEISCYVTAHRRRQQKKNIWQKNLKLNSFKIFPSPVTRVFPLPILFGNVTGRCTGEELPRPDYEEPPNVLGHVARGLQWFQDIGRQQAEVDRHIGWGKGLSELHKIICHIISNFTNRDMCSFF